MASLKPVQGSPKWKLRMHEIVFEAETPAGKAFDFMVLTVIALSVIAVILGSVASIDAVWGRWLLALEWACTIFFTVE